MIVYNIYDIILLHIGKQKDSQTLTLASIELCGKKRQTSPTSEACSICALDSALATASMLQAPSAIHDTAAPCHVLVADVQMVVPLLARQRRDSSELGT